MGEFHSPSCIIYAVNSFLSLSLAFSQNVSDAHCYKYYRPRSTYIYIYVAVTARFYYFHLLLSFYYNDGVPNKSTLSLSLSTFLCRYKKRREET